MPKNHHPLSKNEWDILNICWEKGEVPARVIYEESLNERKRAYMTIKSTLDRLVGKGYLHSKRLGPILLYRPAVSRAKVLARSIENFVGTMLDNTLAPVITHFAKRGKLNPEDIEALEELLNKSREN